jgi:serine/threonine protein kinase
VYEARNDVEEISIAMKTVPFDSDPDSVKMARREIQVFQSLGSRHPNLLPLLFGAETESELVLLTPYAPSGDLYSLTNVAGGTFKCLEEQDAGNLCEQILTGLVALHGQRIMHGDIKPHNVFLTKADDGFVAQLGDFGLSRKVGSEEEGVPSEGGTPGYMAPEMVGHLQGTERPLVSFGADLFAMGIMTYELLSSMSPFDPPSNVRAPLEFDDGCWEPLDPQARVFVERLLEKKNQDRGTAADALDHPWMAAAAVVERGKKREMWAPRPDDKLRFHSMSRVWEISGLGPTQPHEGVS